MSDQLRQLFDAAASGHVPPRSEINEVAIDDALSQPEAALFRRNLITALDDVADLAATGARGPARDLGKRLAGEMADQTAEPTPASADLPDDPATLAGLVNRSGEPGRRPVREPGTDPRSLGNRTRSGQRGR